VVPTFAPSSTAIGTGARPGPALPWTVLPAMLGSGARGTFDFPPSDLTKIFDHRKKVRLIKKIMFLFEI